MPVNDQGDAYKLLYPFGWQVTDRWRIASHIAAHITCCSAAGATMLHYQVTQGSDSRKLLGRQEGAVSLQDVVYDPALGATFWS